MVEPEDYQERRAGYGKGGKVDLGREEMEPRDGGERKGAEEKENHKVTPHWKNIST